MQIIFKTFFFFVLIVNNIFYFNFQRGCVQRTVTDEDKSHDKQDLDKAKQIDTNNQLSYEQNITQTDVPDYTVITYHCL